MNNFWNFKKNFLKPPYEEEIIEEKNNVYQPLTTSLQNYYSFLNLSKLEIFNLNNELVNINTIFIIF